MGSFTTVYSPQNGKGLRNITSTAKTSKERGEQEFGSGCQENCCCCQCHPSQPARVVQDKVPLLWATEELPSPGSFQEEDWELAAAGCWTRYPGSPSNGESKSGKPTPLLLLRVSGDNVLLILNPLKIHKVSPEAEQRRSNCFRSANCSSSAVSPGDSRDTVFHKVRKNK